MIWAKEDNCLGVFVIEASQLNLLDKTRFIHIFNSVYTREKQWTSTYK